MVTVLGFSHKLNDSTAAFNIVVWECPLLLWSLHDFPFCNGCIRVYQLHDTLTYLVIFLLLDVYVDFNVLLL